MLLECVAPVMGCTATFSAQRLFNPWVFMPIRPAHIASDLDPPGARQSPLNSSDRQFTYRTDVQPR
jgi:hypothetical protein